MTGLLILIANILTLLANLGVLWIVIKIYSEILKVGHIKSIGKRPGEPL